MVAAVGLLALRWPAQRAGVVARLTAVLAAVLGLDLRGLPARRAADRRARRGADRLERPLHAVPDRGGDRYGKTKLGIAAVQNVAGSHASLLAPQRLVLAAAATALEGSEGRIARTALAPVALRLALLAVVAAIAP